MQRKLFWWVIWAMSALAGAIGVAAADYPDKPVRMIIGFPAGSGVDILARLAGPKLAETYGQQFVIDNRPGAGSNIAANLAAKAAPDGYTIFLGTVANAMLFAISSAVLPHIKSGRLRALAITTLARMPSLPEVPTVAESGLPGFEAVTWFGFMVPAATPRDIVGRLNADIGKVLALPDVHQQLALQGIAVIGGTPEQFAEHVRKETAKWADVIRRSGAKVD